MRVKEMDFVNDLLQLVELKNNIFIDMLLYFATNKNNSFIHFPIDVWF